MNLEDLKKELSSQATEDMKVMEKRMFNMEREVELRKKECINLREKNAELLKEVNHTPPITVIPTNEKIADVIKSLSNRCMALSHGTMCSFCTIQEYCRVESIQALRILLDRIGMPGADNL